MKLRVIGNQSPTLIERMLQVNGLNETNYELLGHHVARSLGMIFCVVKEKDRPILCFTAMNKVNEYLENMQNSPTIN